MSQATELQTHSAQSAAPRVPISLRLPPQIISQIDSYADEHRMTKTDAFLYFVQKGMTVSSSEPQVEKLNDIDRRLERIEELLGKR